VKPDFTFARAVRMVAARWWVIVACIVVVVALAASLENRRLTSATASARLHEQDTTVAYLAGGQPQPYTRARSVNELTRGDFVDAHVAAAAAKKLGDITGPQLAGAIGFSPLNGTDVELSYSGNGSSEQASKRLETYLTALIDQRRSAQRAQLLAAADRIRTANGPNATEVAQRLQSAADSLSQQIFQVGSVTVSKSRTIPTAAVIAGAAVAGAILGVLIALALGRFDTRIRRASDIRQLGLRTLDVSATDQKSIDTLRALVEVGGVDAAGGTVAVVPASGAASSIARDLATSFAASGRPTMLLSESGASRFEDDGWTAIPGEADPLGSLPRLRTALADGSVGEVTVIQANGVLDHPEAVLASAVADLTVVVVRSGRSTWSELERALYLLEDSVVAGRVRVCLEQGRGTASPGATLRRTPRVQDATGQLHRST
jgi:hypothetical protein